MDGPDKPGHDAYRTGLRDPGSAERHYVPHRARDDGSVVVDEARYKKPRHLAEAFRFVVHPSRLGLRPRSSG